MYPSYPYHGHETISVTTPVTFAPQHQAAQPGRESAMDPRPIAQNPDYHGSGKLRGRVALVTGGDSGIGRAVAVAFAKEGASVAVFYLNEKEDAAETKTMVEQAGGQCLLLEGDVQSESSCAAAVKETVGRFMRLDILVNNAGVQYPQNSILDISAEQLEHTFRTDVFSLFHMTKAALPHLESGSAIINTASVTAFAGHQELIDYSAAKGAVVAFTRSLALSLVTLGIRVNAVAPGATWTPLIPASFPAEKVKAFGANTPMKRPAQPFELAPAYVYLASADAGFVTGQVLHVNGGAVLG